MTATAPTPMNIGAFLSATDLDELYTQPTREFGALIVRAGYPLVWGGSDTGLMKVLTDGVQASGGRLTGISVDFLRKWVRTDADEMTFARDLAERKARLLSADTNPLMLPVTPGSSSSSDAMS